MNKKGIGFLEEHIEKIVLVVVIIICFWLFATRIVISPNYVEYDNRKLSPGSVDEYVLNKTKFLEDELNRQPEPLQPYQPRLGDFTARLNLTVSDIDSELSLPLPPHSSAIVAKPKYELPLITENGNVKKGYIGQIEDVQVEAIRAVAYMPAEPVTAVQTYEQVEHEPNDLDFVTVQASFDMVDLRERFKQCFAGENIKPSWQDPCLAKPVFASVQLQRQQMDEHNRWSDWQIVDLPRTEHRRELFKSVEKVKNLPPGGIELRFLQLADNLVQNDILQPKPYRIASAQERWFPPTLHKEFLKYQKEINAQEKRQAMQERKTERQQQKSDRLERRGRGSATRSRRTGETEMEEEDYDSEQDGPAGRPIRDRREIRDTERPERVKKPSQTIEDINKKYEEIRIAKPGSPAQMNEQPIFWAHDDTAEPGKTYRYRIRLGVLNPVAGTGRLAENYSRFEDKVILWSRFSDVTETVKIPAMSYFFPRNIQEATKTVTIQISKYKLGSWYSKDFVVNQGETIGKVAETKRETNQQENLTIPEQINYSTGAAMIDVRPVNDWSSGKDMSERYYFKMLYSFDGKIIDEMPIKTRYWSKQLQTRFNEIRNSQKEPKEPLLSWEDAGGITGATEPSTEIEDWEEEEEEEYY